MMTRSVMTRAGRVGLVLVCIAVHAVAAPTPTKTANPATPAAKAKDPLAQRMADANAALAARDYARALPLYQQVDAIDSTVSTKLGIAASLQGLGRLPEAYDVYDQLLRAQGATLARHDFERVEQGLAALRASTSVIALQLNEAGAEVTLDKQVLGTTPLDRAVRRMPGQAVVSVRKPGFEPWTQTLDLRPGEERRVAVELVAEKKSAWLIVRSAGGEPANLQIDGKDVGPLPFAGEVAEGEHQLVAKSPKGQSPVRALSAVARGRFELELAIQQIPARLRVSSVEPTATIQIDSVPVATGRFEGELPAGNHVITIEKPGFEPQIIKLTVEPGERANLDNISLLPLGQAGKSDPSADFSGFYGKLAVDGTFGRPTHSIALDCPVTESAGSCKSWTTMGAQLDFRFGHAFGIVGVEALVLLGANFSRADLAFPNDLSAGESAWYGIARQEHYLLVNPTAALGLAGRVASKSQPFRLSSAWGVGLAWHKPWIGRTLEPTPKAEQDSIVRTDANVGWTDGKSQFVPIVIWDADIELGNTPGLKFLLGLHCQLEFGKGPTTSVGDAALGYNQAGARLPVGGGEIQAWGSPSFFVGPRIGLALGH